MGFVSPTSLGNIFASQPKSQSLGLYLHIPFCQTRCHFCAFYVHVHQEDRVLRFLACLHREIELYARQFDFQQYSLDTIYFGGGTPTALSSDQLCCILDSLVTAFPVGSEVEVSLEAHPNTVTVKKLATLRRAGVNRISLGVQSFDHAELDRLGGGGEGKQALRAINDIRDAGFQNVNVDLMYGLPGQTLISWEATLEQVIRTIPTHLSCYALTIEDGTRFAADHRQGFLHEATDELCDAMEERTRICLQSAGYERYEISNYCRPGYACQHNLRYWQGKGYLGLGPSAQSYVHATRFGNEKSLEWYCHELEQDRLPVVDIEPLQPDHVAREAVMFGLRLLKGVPIPQQTNGGGKTTLWKQTIPQLIADCLLMKKNGRLMLTDRGIHVADSVAELLFHA